MLELARLRVGLLVANLEQERVRFETVGDLQQCQSQRGTSLRRELGRFGRELEQQTFVIEHLGQAGRQCVGMLVWRPRSSGHGTQSQDSRGGGALMTALRYATLCRSVRLARSFDLLRFARRSISGNR